MQVLLLEPDPWRFLGISQILTSEPGIKLLGERDYRSVILLKSPPPDLQPDVVIVSHSLILDYQISILNDLHNIFPQANLLVEGYDANLDSVADVLRGGAQGYFTLSSDPAELLKAISVIRKGSIWAPREALMSLLKEGAEPLPPPADRTPAVSRSELLILQMLGEGLGNKEIAQRLGLAEVTVKSQLTRLFRKFRVKTRLGLLAYAVNHHLISDRELPAPDADRRR